ncbi:MAG TPA: bifunctional UDP-N-acetylglucosamine diphosphorylase/glucosamine-1-phosphate N-acetyltransferase GlmU [Steroidobacteraceae bacterium]
MARKKRAQSPPLAVIILAAGQGKRMRSDLPKVLQPLAGRPLLKHVIDTALSLQPAATCIVYGHGGEQVRAALSAEPVEWVLQAQRLGTGHAVSQAMPRIADDQLVLVLYGDVPLVRRQTLDELLQLAGPRRVALLTMLPEDPTGYGRIVRNTRGQVQRIIEHQDAGKQQLRIREANTGIVAAPARLLKKWLKALRNDNSQGEYYLTDIIAMAVRERIPVLPMVVSSAEVVGVNDKAQLAQVEALHRQRINRELLLAGVTIADPSRCDVRGTLLHGEDVFIDVGVVLEGTVRLGNRVRVGPYCVVRNSEIGEETCVFGHCIIDSADIGANCLIGPFARLRPAAVLGQGVHIGNFVEVKNSRMGGDSKANHLAYVGDAQLGSRVNIGAGTIIANYDGAHKNRTTIGDDVHTGSNSVLVAPMTVGAGATIAAGSTVVKEVPPGGLTVARARQLTIADWRRPVKPKK